MLVNADFSRRAMVFPHQYEWVPSPQPGVERVMLDRIGAERARATSIVRYAPDSHFPSHAHPGGEEILVLSGVFSEDDEHYPAGWYMRNPPGSAHAPSSADGATIFVKLWQMDEASTELVRIDTGDPAQWQQANGRAVCQLYANGVEEVSLQRLAEGHVMPLKGAAEMLLLQGEAAIDGQHCSSGTWVRWPQGDRLNIVAGSGGVSFYLKTLAPIHVSGKED